MKNTYYQLIHILCPEYLLKIMMACLWIDTAVRLEKKMMEQVEQVDSAL